MFLLSIEDLIIVSASNLGLIHELALRGEWLLISCHFHFYLESVRNGRFVSLWYTCFVWKARHVFLLIIPKVEAAPFITFPLDPFSSLLLETRQNERDHRRSNPAVSRIFALRGTSWLTLTRTALPRKFLRIVYAEHAGVKYFEKGLAQLGIPCPEGWCATPSWRWRLSLTTEIYFDEWQKINAVSFSWILPGLSELSMWRLGVPLNAHAAIHHQRYQQLRNMFQAQLERESQVHWSHGVLQGFEWQGMPKDPPLQYSCHAQSGITNKNKIDDWSTGRIGFWFFPSPGCTMIHPNGSKLHWNSWVYQCLGKLHWSCTLYRALFGEENIDLKLLTTYVMSRKQLHLLSPRQFEDYTEWHAPLILTGM